MKILLITQLFPPEMGAQSNRMYPIVRHFVRAGHQVTVATGMPNYPDGVVFPEYRGKRWLREEIDGFVVQRTAYYTVPRNKSKVSQLLSYMSFLRAVLSSCLRSGPADVVFVTSPPIFPVLPALVVAKKWSARLVFDIRDLWPDELVAVGAATDKSPIVQAIRAIERLAYRRADLITCTTPAFSRTVASRGASPDKIILAPNGADLDVFYPRTTKHPVVEELSLGDRFVVMYSGLLGMKHGLEALIDAADQLRAHTDIVFVIVGNGIRRAALAEDIQRRSLSNVILAGERKLTDLPHLLSRSDVCVTTLLPDAYLDKIIPAKIFEYMACERPVVAAVSGEASRILSESGAGIVVEPGNGKALSAAILELYADAPRRQQMGKLGRRFVEKHYSRNRIAERIEENLRGLRTGQ